MKALQAELQQQKEVAAAQQGEQAVAHAKEITQLTEAHKQMQSLVTTLTEENAVLDKVNPDTCVQKLTPAYEC